MSLSPNTTAEGMFKHLVALPAGPPARTTSDAPRRASSDPRRDRVGPDVDVSEASYWLGEDGDVTRAFLLAWKGIEFAECRATVGWLDSNKDVKLVSLKYNLR